LENFRGSFGFPYRCSPTAIAAERLSRRTGYEDALLTSNCEDILYVPPEIEFPFDVRKDFERQLSTQANGIPVVKGMHLQFRWEILGEISNDTHSGSIVRAFDHHLRKEVVLKGFRRGSRSAISEKNAMDNVNALMDNSTEKSFLGGSITDFEFLKRHIFVYPYYSNGYLESYMKRNYDRFENLLFVYSLQILRALSNLKQLHMIHNDIKPNNIMIDDDGDAVLIDFELSQHLEYGYDNITYSSGGTLAYMAPEKLALRHSSYQSDMWAFGVSIYDLLFSFIGKKGCLHLKRRDGVDSITHRQYFQALQQYCLAPQKHPYRWHPAALFRKIQKSSKRAAGISEELDTFEYYLEIDPKLVSLMRKSLLADPYDRITPEDGIDILMGSW
jgi:serine/threonine protein kinase